MWLTEAAVILTTLYNQRVYMSKSVLCPEGFSVPGSHGWLLLLNRCEAVRGNSLSIKRPSLQMFSGAGMTKVDTSS